MEALYQVANMGIFEPYVHLCPRKPFDHQVVGVETIVPLTEIAVGRILPGCFGLFDEMGAGKTKQAIDVAQILFLEEQIDQVIVVCPSSVRSVWFDPETGQIQAHRFTGLPLQVTEIHRKKLWWGEWDTKKMSWFITNYEWVRMKPHLTDLLKLTGPRTLLILDESSAVKNHTSLQSRSCFKLRQKCGRVILLNGTPTTASPEDIFSQAYIMDPNIIGCASLTHFRARYGISTLVRLPGRKPFRQVIGWRHHFQEGCCEQKESHPVHEPDLPGIEEIQKKLAPYVLRRLKEDCLDLPPKLPPVSLEVALSRDTWSLYQEMRKEFMVWLGEHRDLPVLAPQVTVREMRLSQILAGWLGGGTEEVACECLKEMLPNPECKKCGGQGVVTVPLPEHHVSSEKSNFTINWVKELLNSDPNLKLLIWSRFRPELATIYKEFKTWGITLGAIRGGQNRDERQTSLNLLKPGHAPVGPVIVCGMTQAGSMGLDLSAAHIVLYTSNDYNLLTRLQSEDRVHRPGQVYPVSYYDLAAVGPDGQQTVDHTIISALRQKVNLAKMTCGAWVARLTA